MFVGKNNLVAHLEKHMYTGFVLAAVAQASSQTCGNLLHMILFPVTSLTHPVSKAMKGQNNT